MWLTKAVPSGLVSSSAVHRRAAVRPSAPTKLSARASKSIRAILTDRDLNRSIGPRYWVVCEPGETRQSRPCPAYCPFVERRRRPRNRVWRLAARRRNALARAMRRVQLQGGARGPYARRTLCTLSVRPGAPTPQMGPYHRSRTLGGGLRPSSEPPPRTGLRRRSRRSNSVHHVAGAFLRQTLACPHPVPRPLRGRGYRIASLSLGEGEGRGEGGAWVHT